MGNVLEKAKQEQVIAPGRLGWSLRRIEAATGVRRETAGVYLRSAGIIIMLGSFPPELLVVLQKPVYSAGQEPTLSCNQVRRVFVFAPNLG